MQNAPLPCSHKYEENKKMAEEYPNNTQSEHEKDNGWPVRLPNMRKERAQARSSRPEPVPLSQFIPNPL